MKYIYVKEKALEEDTCNYFINYFETNKLKHSGKTCGGLDLNFKKSIETTIFPSSKSNYYIDLFRNIIRKNVEIYMKENNITYKKIPFYEYNNLFIKKYVKNEGKFEYHNDFSITDKSVRIITYLFYLNNVEEGGETEFLGDFKVKPEKGKMIIFPCSWTFPHSGKIPISNDKYIISGWLYIDIENLSKLHNLESV